MPNAISRRGALGVAAALLLVGPAGAADMQSPRPGPDLTHVRVLIKAKDYAGALKELRVLEPNNPHPDVYNLIGYTLRKTGDRPQAMTYYNKALALDPSHKGALEYQGELFVEIGQIDKAKENLRRLNSLCWSDCEEEDDLKAFIAKAGKG